MQALLRFDTEGDGSFLLAVEAQGKKDPDKPASWAYYASYLLTKYRLQPMLLVVCQDRATAEWALVRSASDLRSGRCSPCAPWWRGRTTCR